MQADIHRQQSKIQAGIHTETDTHTYIHTGRQKMHTCINTPIHTDIQNIQTCRQRKHIYTDIQAATHTYSTIQKYREPYIHAYRHTGTHTNTYLQKHIHTYRLTA